MPPVPLLQRPDIASVVVFRALQVGDMLCAVPALRALRAALPQARITLVGLPWATQFASRFGAYIDEFVPFPGHPNLPEIPAQRDKLPGFYEDMRSRHFSLALQLHGSGEISNGVVAEFGAELMAGYAPADSAQWDGLHFFPYPGSGAEPLRLLELLLQLGAPESGAELEFPLTPLDWAELEQSGLAMGLEAGNYVCLHPGARFRDKCWPPQRFAQLADRIAMEFGLTIVITGSGQEHDLAQAVMDCMATEAINAAAPISLGAMAALMSCARLLVCNDTGVSHIAAGLKLPSVVIFNKADMERWGPLDRQLHRCLRDPAAEGLEEAWAMARALLAGRTQAT
jgi:ADP-heptose:LPS heptosyltransferase